VAGCSPADRFQIHIPINCVIVHSWRCHHQAQFHSAAQKACVKQILAYHAASDVTEFILYMEERARTKMIRARELLGDQWTFT
jgi:hypothetical protein